MVSPVPGTPAMLSAFLRKIYLTPNSEPSSDTIFPGAPWQIGPPPKTRKYAGHGLITTFTLPFIWIEQPVNELVATTV